MKIIYGVTRPDRGEMVWEGQAIIPENPVARTEPRHRHGVPALLAVRDAFGGRERGARAARARPDLGYLARRIEKSVREVRPAGRLPPSRPCGLSVGERQRVEIIRCLLQNPKLLIMDEPTSVLTPQAVRKLFETLRHLSGEGCSILYISHKLDEIQELCTRQRCCAAARSRAPASRRRRRRSRWRG